TQSTLRVFDTETGKERVLSAGHRAPVMPRFAADGATLVTACDEVECRWRVSPGPAPALLARTPRNAWEPGSSARSPEGRLFLHEADSRVTLRETATGRVLGELTAGRSYPNFGVF